jgi:hypothetical protein
LDVVVGGPDIERVGGLGNLICMFEEKGGCATSFLQPLLNPTCFYRFILINAYKVIIGRKKILLIFCTD